MDSALGEDLRMVIHGTEVRGALCRPGASLRAQPIARPCQAADRNRSQTKFGISWRAEIQPLAGVGKISTKASRSQADSLTLSFDSTAELAGPARSRRFNILSRGLLWRTPAACL
jgi:hypothetical protein